LTKGYFEEKKKFFFNFKEFWRKVLKLKNVFKRFKIEITKENEEKEYFL
jgi:hypothetical protein